MENRSISKKRKVSDFQEFIMNNTQKYSHCCNAGCFCDDISLKIE